MQQLRASAAPVEALASSWNTMQSDIASAAARNDIAAAPAST